MKPTAKGKDLALKEFRRLSNTIKSYISFGKIKTIRDSLNFVGAKNLMKWDGELDEPITYVKWTKDIEPSLLQEIEDRFNPFSALNVDDIGSTIYDSLVRDSLIESRLFDSVISSTPPEDSKVNHYGNLIKDLLPPKSEKQKARLYAFQQHAADEILYKFLVEKARGLLLRANTGDGKTYVYGQIFRWLIDLNFKEGKTFSPYPFVLVTKASIVEQTKRDLEFKFGIDTVREVLVIHYDALRATFGEMFLDDIKIVEDGEIHHKWKWKPFMFPLFVIWDECQALKNEDSQQSKIAQALNDLPIDYWNQNNVIQLFGSATPFARVSGAKCFCVATKTKIKTGLGEVEITNQHWKGFAQEIAGEGVKIEEYSKPAVKRLLRRMSYYIVGFKNVHRRHKAINTEQQVDFETKEQEQAYIDAWKRYLEEKGKLEGGEAPSSRFLILVEFLKFRQAAEFLRADMLARLMWMETQIGKACLCGLSFKPTIAKAMLRLYQNYNIKRNQISVIWGGDDAYNKKEQFTQEQIIELLTRAATHQDVPKKTLKQVTKQLQASNQGLSDIPPELELGKQTREQRQQEIDKFQSGESLYCFFTFGAGGAGLSLHHTHEYFEDRPKEFTLDKATGLWLRLKDKKLVTTRPRRSYIAPTYNEMELEQSLGRAPRLTSMSDTLQTILLFRGTIEVDVLHRANQKRRCLTEVVKHSEMIKEFLGAQEIISELMTLGGSKDKPDEDDDDDEGREIYEDED